MKEPIMIAWYGPKETKLGLRRRGGLVWYPNVHTIIRAEDSSPDEFEGGADLLRRRDREHEEWDNPLKPSVVYERVFLAVRAGFQKDVVMDEAQGGAFTVGGHEV